MAKKMTRNLKMYEITARVYDSAVESVTEIRLGLFERVPAERSIYKMVRARDEHYSLLSFSYKEAVIRVGIPNDMAIALSGVVNAEDISERELKYAQFLNIMQEFVFGCVNGGEDRLIAGTEALFNGSYGRLTQNGRERVRHVIYDIFEEEEYEAKEAENRDKAGSTKE